MQRAILVGVKLQKDVHFAASMMELNELAIACEVETVGQVTQQRDQIDGTYYIGKDKLKEVEEQMLQTEANLVIFNDELSPSQIRNIEAVLACKVIDRTMLILDIFARRARTKEAQLQVSIAELEYMLPRLVGLRASLGRQSGGVGTHNRGAGETQLELDRRRIETKIAHYRRELKKWVQHRQTQRGQRKKNNIPVVALVGYTNAGKSTLMNAMVERYHPRGDKKVWQQDLLFATLETAVRRISLPEKKSFLLTDTVGFVSKLPHHLVKAFRSTLEEVAEADLLIHVVDLSHPHHEQQMETTLTTLQEIGVKEIPTIVAYNKADLTGMAYPQQHDQRIYLSAQKGVGIEELVDLIRQQLFPDDVECEMWIPYEQGRIVAQLHERAQILKQEHDLNGTRLMVRCSPVDYRRYQAYVQ
jgi:GTP-binding protein HflX